MYIGIDYLNNTIDTGITNISSNLDEDDDGSDIYYGTGIEVNFINLKARVGYSLYDLDGGDIDSTNVGLSYSF